MWVSRTALGNKEKFDKVVYILLALGLVYQAGYQQIYLKIV